MTAMPRCSREQFDCPVHNLLLGGLGPQFLRGLLGHVAEANQQGIQSFGHLGVWRGEDSNHMNGSMKKMNMDENGILVGYMR